MVKIKSIVKRLFNRGKTFSVGVDWNKGKWIAVAINESTVESKTFETIADLCEFYKKADVILIDVPIGLPETEAEAAERPDRAARDFLTVAKRKSSVFNTPFRQIVYEEDPGAAWELREELNAKISKQGIGICKCIRQVDKFILSNPEWKGRLLESHPECAFQALDGNVGLEYSKHTKEGLEERCNILKKYSDKVDATLAMHKRGDINDVLDAYCLAITGMLATKSKKGFLTLPENVKTDRYGIPMKISVYICD